MFFLMKLDVPKDGTEKEHHYKMTILSKCIEKNRIKDVYDGDEIEI